MRAISYILLTLISIANYGQTDVKVKRLYSDSVKVGAQWISPYQWEKLKTSVIVDSNKFSTHYYTNRQIAAATTGLVDPRGQWNASTGTFPSTGGSGTAGAILKGDYWSISVEGTIGGVLYTVGSSLLAMVDNPGQTATNWDKQITGSTLAVRTFGDINSGVPAYSGTTLVAGQFFGGNLTPNANTIGGYNGYFNTRSIEQGVGYARITAGYAIRNILFQTAPGATNMLIYDANNATRTWLSPTSSATSTPYMFDTESNHTSGNLHEWKNYGTTKAAIDYTGKLLANGADFGTNSTTNNLISASNTGQGTGVSISNSGLYGQYITNSGTYGQYISNTGTYAQRINSTGNTGTYYVSSGTLSIRINEAGNGIPFQVDSLNSIKLKIDSKGDILNDPPHASSWFADSSRLITLTQNTWTGITNTWKKLYPSSGANYYFNKITKTGDSCKITKAGRYEIIYELNATGTANATYEYRLCKRSGSTITYYNKQVLVGTGATVVRIVSGSLALIANDVVWAEVRTTTAGNNSITVIGGQIRVKTIKLDL